MASDSLISIIVPIYNSQEYLDRCIKSLLAQTHKKLEIILVDDGSTDNSSTICDSYAKLDSRILVLHKINEGQAAARNDALIVANGDYIGFVDSDDWIEDDMYSNLLENALKYNCDISICGRNNVDDSGNTIDRIFCMKEPVCYTKEQAIKNFLIWNNIDGSPCDKLFRRELIVNQRFPLGYICEDVPFVFKALLNSNGVVHCGLPLYNYFQRTGSTSHSTFSERTEGLIIYSREIKNEVDQRFPNLQEESSFFYLNSYYNYLRIYYGGDNKVVEQKPFSLKDFRNRYFSWKKRFILFLLKIKAFSLIKWLGK